MEWFYISLIQKNIDENDVEGIYWDKDYTIKYNNEKIYVDSNLYLKRIEREYTFDTLSKDIEEIIKSDYQKKYSISYKQLTIDDVKIKYYIGTYNDCVIAMYTHQWMVYIDGPCSQRIAEGYTIGYPNNNYLMVWKENEFMTLEKAYSKGYISIDDFNDIKYRYYLEERRMYYENI